MSDERSRKPDEYTTAPVRSGFGKLIGPLYHAPKTDDARGDTYWLGFQAEDKHSGSPGRGHGGMLMTLLDEAMGRAATLTVNAICVTVSMQTNFCASYRVGDFLRVAARVVKQGRNLVFVEASVYAGDTLLSTASGVWSNTGHPIPE